MPQTLANSSRRNWVHSLKVVARDFSVVGDCDAMTAVLGTIGVAHEDRQAGKPRQQGSPTAGRTMDLRGPSHLLLLTTLSSALYQGAQGTVDEVRGGVQGG
jgi:hypothetical protein